MTLSGPIFTVSYLQKMDEDMHAALLAYLEEVKQPTCKLDEESEVLKHFGYK